MNPFQRGRIFLPPAIDRAAISRDLVCPNLASFTKDKIKINAAIRPVTGRTDGRLQEFF